ncbi:MAG: helix-turn-helix transcriptional regulator [Neisseriaceae bacterium]|nr:helix-turn-helix domain-containing protein [Neisseriaceae bacterium]
MNGSPKQALGEFIRAQRERILPVQVGLPSGTRRRTPGLRREEVAALSGISTTWLAWLEQGRTETASAKALSRLAKALLMTPAEQKHLFELAGLHLDPKEPTQKREVEPLSSVLQKTVDNILVPAMVYDRYWDLAYANATAADLFAHWFEQEKAGINLLDYLFLDPHSKHFMGDWAALADRVVVQLRAEFNNHADDEALQAYVRGWMGKSPEFAAFWNETDDAALTKSSHLRKIKHQVSGEMTYHSVTLNLTEAPGLKLVVLNPCH